MESDFRRERTRRDIVRAAERGKEVIERKVVRQVDDRQSRTHFVLFLMEQVVMADRQRREAMDLGPAHPSSSLSRNPSGCEHGTPN